MCIGEAQFSFRALLLCGLESGRNLLERSFPESDSCFASPFHSLDTALHSIKPSHPLSHPKTFGFSLWGKTAPCWFHLRLGKEFKNQAHGDVANLRLGPVVWPALHLQSVAPEPLGSLAPPGRMACPLPDCASAASSPLPLWTKASIL